MFVALFEPLILQLIFPCFLTKFYWCEHLCQCRHVAFSVLPPGSITVDDSDRSTRLAPSGSSVGADEPDGSPSCVTVVRVLGRTGPNEPIFVRPQIFLHNRRIADCRTGCGTITPNPFPNNSASISITNAFYNSSPFCAATFSNHAHLICMGNFTVKYQFGTFFLKKRTPKTKDYWTVNPPFISNLFLTNECRHFNPWGCL